MTRPIIAALLFREEDQKLFQEARDRWFPPRLNQVPAHLTLFHHLPGREPDAVEQAVRGVCSSTEPFDLMAEKLVPLGGGFAYLLPSQKLSRLRADLAECFEGQLTKQDASGFRAHVTVQNKVTPDTAKLCLEEHTKTFEAFTVRAEGVKLWFYDGGPWEAFASIPFGSDSAGEEAPLGGPDA
ncbi:2'-5' RNA ligase family protein [Parvularcula maris]|uniref:2'-5' RNA ligase family protein n=1 Tax=Parvularcula maris TaxID=2965077 RepID=A0A9X2RI24_9PROT|nr:2'-5' RNA ligase family protein [Parvularcula maris]MCQ8185595.1 2'-5' RNA ligase family protein [Parvularcula maris]